MKTYIVCMDPHYVRDAQVFQTENYSEEELNQINIHSEHEENSWRDAEITPYIDIVQAHDEDTACHMVANRFRYDVKCLYATEIKHLNTRKGELFDNMIAHIQELVSSGDMLDTFRAIGFTDDEFVEYEICAAKKVRFKNLLDETIEDIQFGILFDDGTIACRCGCKGIFEEGDYEILSDENVGGEKQCQQ